MTPCYLVVMTPRKTDAPVTRDELLEWCEQLIEISLRTDDDNDGERLIRIGAQLRRAARLGVALPPSAIRDAIADELDAAAAHIRATPVGPESLRHQGARMTWRESADYLHNRAAELRRHDA